MKLTHLIFGCLLGLLLVGCEDTYEQTTPQSGPKGNFQILLSTSQMPVVQTRSTEAAENAIESVNLFLFEKGSNRVFKKMFQYIDRPTAEVSLYLSQGIYSIHAIGNWHNPEELNEQIHTLDDLHQLSLQLDNPDDAFMGKYVMYGKKEPVTVDANPAPLTLEMNRLASLHDFTIRFVPEDITEKFQLTEAWIHQVPRGCWVAERNEPSNASGSCTADWTYQANPISMQARYFTSSRLTLQESGPEPNASLNKPQWTVQSTYAVLENRRGGLPVDCTPGGVEYSEKYWPGSQALALTNVSLLESLRQFYKRHHALHETENNTPKFEQATYLTLHGIYQNEGGTSEVTYYVYLGADNYKDFNLRRNHKYVTTIDIKSVNLVDTRVEATSLEEITLVASDETLDAHCNVVKAVLFSPDPWEVWVVDPDLTPWLEISGSSTYRHIQWGASHNQTDQEIYPGYRMEGNTGTFRTLYLHTDEYIPDLKDPMKNSTTRIRTGKIAFRKKGSPHTHYLTVKQAPAQLAVLHIKYDVHTLKEVRDTFYIERKLEKKYLPWGLESYWSFLTDDLIASGQWDGLSNTRKLYQVALFGDKWGVKPAYPAQDYPQGIPQDNALGYVVNKNRDRDGNGKIDRDEILWYFPARKELQALYPPLTNGQLMLENDNSIFHSSTPSSADPGGITVGFSYYVKMANGKYGIGQRNRPYNVVALRRKHREWSGPQAEDAHVTVRVETGWTEEEIIMPKQ